MPRSPTVASEPAGGSPAYLALVALATALAGCIGGTLVAGP